MSGWRIHHPTLRDCILQLYSPRKTAQGRDGTINLKLDADGNTIVSEGILKTLEKVAARGDIHGFIVLNEVLDPPAQTVGINPSGIPARHMRTFALEGVVLRELAPQGVNPRVQVHGVKPRVRSI